MKKILILLFLTLNCAAQEVPKTVDLENISIKGLDKNVAKVFKQTKKLILNARKDNDETTELLGTKNWCYLLHNFDFLEQAKNCYFIIGLKLKEEANWPYLYGKASLKQGNIEDSIIGFEQTLRREGNYLPAHYYLIQIAIEQGDLLKAFEYHSKVPANLKLTANMLNISGDLFTQVENYYVANGYYQQALNLVPKANSLNYKIAQNYQLLEKSELAEQFIVGSGQIGISVSDPYFQSVKDTTVGEIPYLIKAKTALNNSDYKLAIKYYNKALEFNADSVSAQINIAVAYFLKKEVDKAKELFEKINLNHPNNLKVLYNLAVITKSQEDFVSAIKYFEDYRKINKQDIVVNTELAEIYYQLKDFEKVINLSSEPVVSAEEKMQVLKAKSLVRENQFDKGVALLKEINKYKPNNNEVLLLLAKIHSQVPDMSIRDGEIALQYAIQAFNNEKNLLSYWELLMALDESKKCNELDQLINEFSKELKKTPQEVKAQMVNQRGLDFRCRVD